MVGIGEKAMGKIKEGKTEKPLRPRRRGHLPRKPGGGGKRKTLLAGNGQAVAPGIAVELGPIVVL
jgi:hypothetical protein